MSPGDECGYDADWCRDALQDQGTAPCIQGCKSGIEPVRYSKYRYRRCSCIEIIFGCLKGWCSVATRYNRSPIASFFTIILATTIILWL